MIQCLNSDIDALKGLLNRGIPTEEKIKKEIEIKTAIIKELEEESCEDELDFVQPHERIPVTLELKTGEWIDDCPMMTDEGLVRVIRCSCCNEQRKDYYGVSKNYCPKCGAKMAMAIAAYKAQFRK